MNYAGRYAIFDPRTIQTYPLHSRTNKVTRDKVLDPRAVDAMDIQIPAAAAKAVDTVARQIIACRKADKPVIVFTGAHLIKNGLGNLLAQLVRDGMVTHVAGNGATAIHDFELALIGQTSEYVPAALEKGQFGMAYEFAYINTAMTLGDAAELGLGESLGKTICDPEFQKAVLAQAPARTDSPQTFDHADISLLAACYEHQVPFTVHVGIGTDVIDQHPSFDGRAKGGCSGRDFLMYTRQIARCTDGGVVLNIGSAVTGPEVLLKAVSMAANVGDCPSGIMTVDFDMRDHVPAAMTDETAAPYYFRDQKSVATRIPQAFGGTGLYVQGDQRGTIPLLFKMIQHDRQA